MTNKAEIKYLNIGNYKTRKDKLNDLNQYKSIYSSDIEWEIITPNKENDWLNLRNDLFSTFIPIEPDKKFNLKTQSYFNLQVIGVATNRDSWMYNFSKSKLENNIKNMISFYNLQLEDYKNLLEKNKNIDINKFIDNDTTKISWSVNLKNYLSKLKTIEYNKNNYLISSYRPFCKQNIYFEEDLIERPGLNKKNLFPTREHKNIAICIQTDLRKEFSILISNNITDLSFLPANQCFPLYYYEKIEPKTAGLFDNIEQGTYRKHSAVSDFILNRVQETHGDTFNKEDIFYYVYGLLHSPIYREKFAVDLKKMLPRIPIVKKFKDFKAFIKAGRDLAELHLNYEEVSACPDVKVSMNLPSPLEGMGAILPSPLEGEGLGERGQGGVISTCETGLGERGKNLNHSSRNYTEITLNQAKELRQKNNLAEKLLWERLRNKNLENIKFKREQPIDKYIVDFVCFEKNLIIELDGGIHNLTDVAIKDIERQEYLENLGFNFLRFNSQEVVNNIEEVLKKIKATYDNLTPNPRLIAASGDDPVLTPNPRLIAASGDDSTLTPLPQPLSLKGRGEFSTHTLKGRGEDGTYTIKGEGGDSTHTLKGRGEFSTHTLKGEGENGTHTLKGRGEVGTHTLKGEGEFGTHTLKGEGEFSTHTLKGEGENIFSKNSKQENLVDFDLTALSKEELFNYYRVEKIKFKDKKDKSCIVYNENITLENIPLKAYEYVVNGKSAIEWILDRYNVNTNKDTQITNDANDWAVEVDKPSYILDLLLSVIELSVKSVEIVDELPEVEFE